MNFKEGDRVRVRADATMWGEPDTGESVHRGETGTVRLVPESEYERTHGLEGYDCWLDITSGRHIGHSPRFFFRELESLEEVAKSHVAEVTERYGKHSLTSCPPHSRAMCDYYEVLKNEN